MKKRVETVITIDRSWNTPENEENEIDIIIPDDTTDYMVYEYDGAESLYIVKNGKLHIYDNNTKKFEECGEMKTSILQKCANTWI